MMRRFVFLAFVTVACGDGGSGRVVGTPDDTVRSAPSESPGSRLESPGVREIPDDSTLTLSQACQKVCQAASSCIPVRGCQRDCVRTFGNVSDDPVCARAVLDYGLCVFAGCAFVDDPDRCVTQELVMCVGDT